ncbi:MAG: hypothetical protein ACI841_004686, partial [Planctomycetota bacterium]
GRTSLVESSGFSEEMSPVFQLEGPLLEAASVVDLSASWARRRDPARSRLRATASADRSTALATALELANKPDFEPRKGSRLRLRLADP